MDTDQGLFKNLFYRHYQDLCNHAFKYLADRDESEDVVQEVMLRFWEIKRELVAEDAAKYYLFTAVRNRCISFIRKRLYTVSTEEYEINIADEIYEEHPGQDINQLVEKAFAGLSPKCAEVFKLSRIEKLTYQQIADKLNISVKTVENHMGKAIKHMRQFIREHPVISLLMVLIIKIIGLI